jgi:hypothetical protein
LLFLGQTAPDGFQYRVSDKLQGGYNDCNHHDAKAKQAYTSKNLE